MSDLDPEAVGWAAIEAALDPIYGDQKPLHWAAAPHWALGGSNPLDGISAYFVPNPAHWHFVSYGMSDLYAKASPLVRTDPGLLVRRDPWDGSAFGYR